MRIFDHTEAGDREMSGPAPVEAPRVGSARIRGLPEAALAPAPHADDDVIDLGVGSPDLEPPAPVVEALAASARMSGHHGYGSSAGTIELRAAIAERYSQRWAVTVDAHREVTLVLGAKEGFAHLMWALVEPGDCVLVPTPSYPVHRAMAVAAGAEVHEYPVVLGEDVAESICDAVASAPRPPRVLVLSLPHNPTTAVATSSVMQRVVDLARARGMLVVHDFAYADFGFGGTTPPSILQTDGGHDVAVELYSLSKSFSMAGWRVGFALGNREILTALGKLKPYVDNGAFLPVQHAALHALTRLADHPSELCAIYEARVARLCEGLAASGWAVETPAAGMYVWAPLPQGWHNSARAFSDLLAREARVVSVPGSAFGSAGEGYVRFALVQPEARVGEATRRIARVVAERGLTA